MKRTLLALVLILVLICNCVPVLADAQSAGMSHFTKQNTYDYAFADVSPSAWYYDAVKSTYEYNLVNGTSATTFSPDSLLTIAQCIKLAVCIHEIYEYGEVRTANDTNGPWFNQYVNNAQKYNIISYIHLAHDAPASRALAASILYHALPENEYKAINPSVSAPDVANGDSFAEDIQAMYRAGILTGSDSVGSFLPNNTIRRSEIATIICRIVDSSARVSGASAEQPKKTEPDTPALAEGQESSWSLDKSAEGIYANGDFMIKLTEAEGNSITAILKGKAGSSEIAYENGISGAVQFSDGVASFGFEDIYGNTGTGTLKIVDGGRLELQLSYAGYASMPAEEGGMPVSLRDNTNIWLPLTRGNGIYAKTSASFELPDECGEIN